MKTKISFLNFILILSFTGLASRSYSQSFFVKFQSDSARPWGICTIYVSGFKNKSVWQVDLQMLANNSFRQFKCDSTTKLYLTIDCMPAAFMCDQTFNCGDSAIVNIDKRSVKFINHK